MSDYTQENFSRAGHFIDTHHANQYDDADRGPDPYLQQPASIRYGSVGDAVDYTNSFYQTNEYFQEQLEQLGQFQSLGDDFSSIQQSHFAGPPAPALRQDQYAAQQQRSYNHFAPLPPPSQDQPDASLLSIEDDYAAPLLGSQDHFNVNLPFSQDMYNTASQAWQSQPIHPGQSSGAVALAMYAFPRVACADCDRHYANKAALNKHRLSKHSGTQPKRILCGIAGCDKSYADLKGVQRHRAVHSRNRQPCKYLCPECKKIYTRRDNTVRHIIQEHPECVYRDRQGGRRLREGVVIERVF